jgi:Predicted solute binding protein
MTHTLLPRPALILLTAACICLLAVPVAAIYTTSDIGGSITRGHQFTIEITGRLNTPYYVWLTRTWSLSGEEGDQPPVVVANQYNVQQDPAGGPYTIGSYKYYNGGGRTILDDVAPTSSLLPNTSYYALVTTDNSGKAVVAFGTSSNTATQSYSVRVENPTSVNNDTLFVERGDTKVNKGSISIAAETRPTRPATTVTTIETPAETETTAVPATTVPVTTAVPATTTTPRLPLDGLLGIAAVGCAFAVFGRR